jgi:hypothetical protein
MYGTAMGNCNNTTGVPERFVTAVTRAGGNSLTFFQTWAQKL